MSNDAMNGKRRSRRRLLKAGAAAGVAAMAGTWSGLAAGTGHSGGGRKDRETLVLVNGRIHTMDGRNRVVSAVAIRNGRFVDVGRGALEHASGASVVDLRGRTVVPGIVEGHIHSVSLANRPGYHTILEKRPDRGDPGTRRAARGSGRPWITSMGGWHPEPVGRHPARHARRARRRRPRPPGLLYKRFTGPAVTNAWARRSSTRSTPGRYRIRIWCR